MSPTGRYYLSEICHERRAERALAGMDDHLAQPLSKPHLASMIRHAVRRRDEDDDLIGSRTDGPWSDEVDQHEFDTLDPLKALQAELDDGACLNMDRRSLTKPAASLEEEAEAGELKATQQIFADIEALWTEVRSTFADAVDAARRA